MSSFEFFFRLQIQILINERKKNKHDENGGDDRKKIPFHFSEKKPAKNSLKEKKKFYFSLMDQKRKRKI